MGKLRLVTILLIAALAANFAIPTDATSRGSGAAAQAAKKRCMGPKGGKKRCKRKKRASGTPSVPDLTAPVPPALSASLPASPGRDTSPQLLGGTEPGSVVRIYTDPDCHELTAAGSAQELPSPGITVDVALNSTTNFYATATDAAGNVSGCSTRGFTYTDAPVEIEVSSTLIPAFAPEVSDYVTRCPGATPVDISVTAPNGSSVSVDGGAPAGGEFTVPVPLEEGQGFQITVQTSTAPDTYFVRCLPSDFPEWTFDRISPPNNDFYVVDPMTFDTFTGRYLIAVDGWGVPVWWFKTNITPIDGRVLSTGNFASTPYDGSGTGYEIRALDGTLLDTVAIIGGHTDIHDLVELPNGNFLLLEYRHRAGADLTACGGPSGVVVTDAVIQEVDPSGTLVREWNSKDHIAPEETGRWCGLIPGPPYDIIHINSIEADGGSVIASMRHTDSIYKIDWPSGEIVWKLGGTTVPGKSLAVLDDPYGAYPFGGQHDARVHPDGTVSIHDNATGLSGPQAHSPRAVRYAIDEDAGTAALVESITDPEVSSSFCCGSARRAPSGAWVMSWGGDGLITEFAPDGSRAFRLSFPGFFSYRAFPVPGGLLTRPALRAGMDAQFPRP